MALPGTLLASRLAAVLRAAASFVCNALISDWDEAS